MTALVKFDGYSDEEEVDVARLQKVKAKGSDATSKFCTVLGTSFYIRQIKVFLNIKTIFRSRNML